MTTTKRRREKFNTEVAPKLAERVGATKRCTTKGRSTRFAYFIDHDDRFVIVAGDQEGEYVDLALAHGLTHRNDRPLVLILPKGREFPTLQRCAWLGNSAQPTVHVHSRSTTKLVALPTTGETIERLRHVGKPSDPADELLAAMTPLHLRHLSHEVIDLVEWATKDRRLDPGHRRGERAWHCMGQKVFSIRIVNKELQLRGGIHTTKIGEPAFEGDDATAPIAATAEIARQRAEKGIIERLNGKRCHPDEHWLQAVIRRDPNVVGVEQPALREVPAWRPAAKPAKPPQPGAWGRGFIDLVGLDGHGHLRIVETKLSSNQDELLFLQGLDYYIWARAYEVPLRAWLGASPHAQIEVHYVIGEDPKTEEFKASRFLTASAAALTIPWRVQTVHDWHHGPEEHDRARSELLTNDAALNLMRAAAQAPA